MSFLQQSLAIDLGTANTVITRDDKVVLDEPSIIAVETKSGKMVAIGRTTAEKVKFSVGSVLKQLPAEEAPEACMVEGRNLATPHPASATINYAEVAECIDKTISKIENEILKVLQRTPPELYSNIVSNGIWLAGGGALLRGIAQRFTEKVHIQFHVAEDPLKAVARGTCIALKGFETYPFLMN
ncbi:MAG: rod shape-determining protein [Bacteroidales bacterium]|nr:rod shape-determining protein [Bacteroidales bacterium]